MTTMAGQEQCPRAEESLGALVLGALDPVERDQVEAHVRSCASCSAILGELAPLPGLLHRIDLPTAEGPPPQDLLERAIAQARGEEAVEPLRRRWKAVAAAGAAAAAAAILVVGMLVSSHPQSVTVSATSAGTDVSARVVVTPTDSGTELALTLEGVPAGEHCQLVAVGRDGSREVASTWIANYEGEAVVTGNTSVTRADLRRLDITTTDGQTLVTIDVPA
jgi:hypothetical protein